MDYAVLESEIEFDQLALESETETTITRITPFEPITFEPIDCFSVLRIKNPTSISQVLGIVDQERRIAPEFEYLITLDDLHQCLYTSMHASQNDLIENNDECDFDNPASVADHQRYMLTKIVKLLEDPTLRHDWLKLSDVLVTSAEDISALAAVNRQPDRLLDETLYIQKLPVKRNDLLIAGLPNGYFSSDWNMFDNHTVICMLKDHGYRFIGIGASWLGFVRDAEISNVGSEQLISDLKRIYGHPENTVAWDNLQQIITQSNYLMLGYTESFTETINF